MTPREALLRVLETLHRAGQAYMLTGALASNYYGIERSTKHADIVIEAAPNDFASFSNTLGPELTLDPQITFETITGSKRHIIPLRKSPYQIELFFVGADLHHQERFTRRRKVHLAGFGIETWIPTAEDVIIQKVRWGRLKDLDDALNVLAVQGSKLDFDYIERWCTTHGTLSRLQELRSSVPPL